MWIWEQTAIISLYSIDWLVFVTETGCVYCAVVLHSTFCPRSVFMCFVWIWEQTAIISLYSIDWLVFVTETGCVYCAVRSTFYILPTQCIYVFCVDLRTISDYFTVQHWLVGFCNWDGVCLLRGTDLIFIIHSNQAQSVWDYGGQTGTVSFFSQYFCFLLSVPLNHCSVITFIHMLILAEGRMCEAWEPSK